MAIALSEAGTRRERFDEPGVRNAILGALAFLEDTLIRPRSGQGPLCCASTDARAPRPHQFQPSGRRAQRLTVSSPFGGMERNRTGEWASHVHFTPKKLGMRGRTLATVQDSNLPCAAGPVYSLFLLSEEALAPDRRVVAPMVQAVVGALAAYADEHGYRFWAPLAGTRSPHPRVGPPNIPVDFTEWLAEGYANEKNLFFRWLTDGQQVPPRSWFAACLDREQNPPGADALFNVPCDADDTALATVIQHLAFPGKVSSGATAGDDAVTALTGFRDIGRARADPHNRWIGPGTGAFLTWLRHEEHPTFANPEAGVIPLGVNNVCAVVNANVALALALTGNRRRPGYAECLALLARAIEQREWPEAGLYYPQRMTFPYAVTRAFRDGAAHEDPLPAAMRTLLVQLLEEQAAWGRRHPRRFGAFPGGEDVSDHLATALGVTALLNIGRPTAAAVGCGHEFDVAVRAGIRRLINCGYRRRPWHDTTRAVVGDVGAKVWEWDTGLFFASSYWDMAHWRSRAHVVGCVLEALVKYVLGFDLDPERTGGKRLALIEA